MALRKILAREMTIEVEDVTPGSWLSIGGIRTLQPASSKSDADTGDFDSEGWAEHIVAERGATLTLNGQYLEDPEDGDRDPGQERVEALARLIGADSLGTFRISTPGGLVRTFEASVSVEGPGGGQNDASVWNATLTVSGDPGAYSPGS